MESYLQDLGIAGCPQASTEKMSVDASLVGGRLDRRLTHSSGAPITEAEEREVSVAGLLPLPSDDTPSCKAETAGGWIHFGAFGLNVGLMSLGFGV